MSFREVRLEIKTCVPLYSGIASIVSILTIVNVVSIVAVVTIVSKREQTVTNVKR